MAEPPHDRQVLAKPAAARDTALEALRGIAALVVVGWHSLLAFAPARSGIFPGMDPTLSLNGHWWFGILNGTASVTFFFVLSGFVLTRRALVSGDTGIIVRGALKRLPRLVGPVLVTCLFSWALLRLGLGAYARAAALSHSPWLAAYGNIPVPPASGAPFTNALREGLFGAVFQQKIVYDSSLWTMQIEFVGSFIAFGLALALIALPRKADAPRLALLAVIGVLAAQFYALPYYSAFVAGVALAALMPRVPVRMPWPVSLPLAAVAFWLAGYPSLLGGHSWLQDVTGMNFVYAHELSAVIAIFAVETSSWMNRLLSAGWVAILGRLSFPVYLLHVPILCTVGSIVFIHAHAAHVHLAVHAAIATTVALTLLLSAPMAWADVWWTRILGKAVQYWVSAASSGGLAGDPREGGPQPVEPGRAGPPA